MANSIVLAAKEGAGRLSGGTGAPIQIGTSTHGVNFFVLDYVETAITSAIWARALPGDYDGGTMKAWFLWTSDAVVSGDVRWEIQAVTYKDSDVLDSTYGSVAAITDRHTTAGDLYIAGPVTLTLPGPGTPAAGEFVSFLVNRRTTHADDDLLGTARLTSMLLEYTATAKLSKSLMYTSPQDTLAASEDWISGQAIRVPAADKHGTWTPGTIYVRVGTVGTGTNTILFRTSTTLTGTRTTRATVNLGTSREASATISWTPADGEYIWVECSAVGGTPPEKGIAQIDIEETVYT